MAASTTRPVQEGRSVLRPARFELAHVRRRGGLIGADGLVMLARAEGLTDGQIRSLVAGWQGRPWPRR